MPPIAELYGEFFDGGTAISSTAGRSTRRRGETPIKTPAHLRTRLPDHRRNSSTEEDSSSGSATANSTGSTRTQRE